MPSHVKRVTTVHKTTLTLMENPKQVQTKGLTPNPVLSFRSNGNRKREINGEERERFNFKTAGVKKHENCQKTINLCLYSDELSTLSSS